MQPDIDYNRRPGKNKALAGFLLIAVGAVFLLHQLNLFFFPYWLFSWPMLLICIGLYSGAKHNFRNPGWFIMVLIGGFFLLDKMLPWNFSHTFWPLIIIIIGLKMIFSRNSKWSGRNKISGVDWHAGVTPGTEIPNDPLTDEAYDPQPLGDDSINAISIFGNTKKTVLSKNFKGGDIVNIFGGAEIDLTQADINGRVIIDVTQMFGGVKLKVPPHWHITTDVVALFAGIDDKRKQFTEPANDKVLVLRGTSLFAGIDIRSF
jgi:predicted membrane protein